MRPSPITIATLFREPELTFRPVGLADIQILRAYLSRAATRSCDFTIGGIIIWKNMFKYEYCIYEDTLFIKSLSEDGSGRQAFLVPVGNLPMYRCIELLQEYCKNYNMPLILTAVPDDFLDELASLPPLALKNLMDGLIIYMKRKHLRHSEAGTIIKSEIMLIGLWQIIPIIRLNGFLIKI